LNPAANRGATSSSSGPDGVVPPPPTGFGGAGSRGSSYEFDPGDYEDAYSGAGSARFRTRRPSLAARHPTLSPLTPGVGASSQFFPADPPLSPRHHDKRPAVEAEQPLWGPPHLPHESAPLMLEALLELQVGRGASLFCDQPASFRAGVQARR